MARKMEHPNEICAMCGKSKNQVLHLMQGVYGYVCDQCIEEGHEMLSEYAEQERRLREHQEHIDATPSQIKSYLDQYVIGQDDAKKTLSVAVYNHYKRMHQKKKSDVEIEKSNILMIGNTGCGKTFLIKCLAKYLGVPLAIADATSLTEAGYVGDDVENILLKLYEKSEGNLEKTQQGIIYIDEIDKLALRGENTSLTRDVSGEGVQQALLKILEGTIARVPFGGGRKHPNAECVNIDTSNILFICGGAFDGLEKLINQDKKVNRTIGFGVDAENISNEEKFTLENVQQHDLVRYGMMPEFIGRLPVITTLAPLTENDMVRILTEPKNAIVRQFQELFAMDDVKLQFEKDALMKIAAIANEKRIGARGLRSIVENVLQKTMFELPDIKSATLKSTLHVDGESGFYGKVTARSSFVFLDYNAEEDANATAVFRRPIASAGSNKTKVAFLQSQAGNKISIRAQYGSASWGTATFTGSSSDIRLKEDIKDSSVNALSKIMQMQIREFNWKQTGIHQELGCVADELELIDPLLTVGGGYDKDGTMNVKCINTLLLTEYNSKAIQELGKENERLNEEIIELRQQLSKTRGIVESILKRSA